MAMMRSRGAKVAPLSVDFQARAEAAEARAEAAPPDEAWFDWERAAELWWRAAQAIPGNPRDRRSYCYQRQDAAKAKASPHVPHH